jgi:hypothetical protein
MTAEYGTGRTSLTTISRSIEYFSGWTERQARTTGSTSHIGRHFRFGGDFNTPTAGFIGGNPAPVNSYAPMLSWSHEFTTDTRLDVRAGPRFTDGGLDNRPEAFVGLRRRIQNGEVTLAYTSALTTVIGTVGATTTDSLLVRFVYQPMRYWTFTVQLTAAWIQNSPSRSLIYRHVEAAYHPTVHHGEGVGLLQLPSGGFFRPAGPPEPGDSTHVYGCGSN